MKIITVEELKGQLKESMKLMDSQRLVSQRYLAREWPFVIGVDPAKPGSEKSVEAIYNAGMITVLKSRSIGISTCISENYKVV